MIRVALCGVVEAGTEGVLRSVSSELEPDTAESREVELGAGSAVVDRLRAMGSLPVGAAVITPGGDLPVSFPHPRGPPVPGGTGEEGRGEVCPRERTPASP